MKFSTTLNIISLLPMSAISLTSVFNKSQIMHANIINETKTNFSWSAVSDTEVFWFFDKEETVFTGFNDDTNGYHILTFSMPKGPRFPQGIKPTEIKELKFRGNSALAKWSWGSWNGTSININNVTDIAKVNQSKKIIEKRIDKSSQIKSEYLTSTYMSHREFGGFGVMNVRQSLGLTWYFDTGKYYLQILIEQYGSVIHSNVGGGLWTYLGTSLLAKY